MNAKNVVRLVVALAIGGGLLFAAQEALADGDYTQRCKSSSIQEYGEYRELRDGGWFILCCGRADKTDGGAMAWGEPLGSCESAEASTLATARSTCRTNWASKRCP